MSIGGNDARAFAGTVATAPAAAALAAASATVNLDRLVAAGAPTISFLAGNTARLPEVATNPAAQAVRNAFSTSFNTAIQGTLAGYAANGVIVHYTRPDADRRRHHRQSDRVRPDQRRRVQPWRGRIGLHFRSRRRPTSSCSTSTSCT